MRQTDGRDASCVLGLRVGEPTQLRVRERSQRQAAGHAGPVRELLAEIVGGTCRAGVVPEQRWADDFTGLVEDDHAVLLSTHADCFDVVEPSGRSHGLLVGGPPCVGMHFGARRVGRGALANDVAGFRVHNQHLAGLRRTVDACNERHAITRQPRRRCFMAAC